MKLRIVNNMVVILLQVQFKKNTWELFLLAILHFMKQFPPYLLGDGGDCTNLSLLQ